MEAAGRAALDLYVARQVQDSMPALRRARRLALWHLYHDTELNSLQIEVLVSDWLREQGLSDSDIVGLGVGHNMVQRIAGSRREPKKRPV